MTEREYRFQGLVIRIKEDEEGEPPPVSDWQAIAEIGQECPIVDFSQISLARMESNRLEFSPELV